MSYHYFISEPAQVKGVKSHIHIEVYVDDRSSGLEPITREFRRIDDGMQVAIDTLINSDFPDGSVSYSRCDAQEIWQQTEFTDFADMFISVHAHALWSEDQLNWAAKFLKSSRTGTTRSYCHEVSESGDSAMAHLVRRHWVYFGSEADRDQFAVRWQLPWLKSQPIPPSLD
jgi:hypothetical protein